MGRCMCETVTAMKGGLELQQRVCVFVCVFQRECKQQDCKRKVFFSLFTEFGGCMSDKTFTLSNIQLELLW